MSNMRITDARMDRLQNGFSSSVYLSIFFYWKGCTESRTFVSCNWNKRLPSK